MIEQILVWCIMQFSTYTRNVHSTYALLRGYHLDMYPVFKLHVKITYWVCIEYIRVM